MRRPTIGMIGSHSAEEIGVAAKANGFETVIVCERGRDRLYTHYNRHLYDHVILVDRFSELAAEDVQQKLIELGTLWIPNRSFSVYVGYDRIERDFKVPLYGHRNLLRVEERSGTRDQYWLLTESGIKTPRAVKPQEIDGLVIVKVQQKTRPLERSFFYAVSPSDYEEKSRSLVERGVVSEEGLSRATIEEFIVAPRFNANFQAYAMSDRFGDLDFAGFDDRIQTNIGGLLNLPAREQLKLDINIVNEEVGHKGITMRESKKPIVYEAAEKLLQGIRRHFPPRLIGLFSLQGALTEDSEFVVFDLSPRVPGAPCLGPTSPEMRRLALKFRREIQSPLDLCMIDIQTAAKEGRLSEAST